MSTRAQDLARRYETHINTTVKALFKNQLLEIYDVPLHEVKTSPAKYRELIEAAARALPKRKGDSKHWQLAIKLLDRIDPQLAEEVAYQALFLTDPNQLSDRIFSYYKSDRFITRWLELARSEHIRVSTTAIWTLAEAKAREPRVLELLEALFDRPATGTYVFDCTACAASDALGKLNPQPRHLDRLEAIYETSKNLKDLDRLRDFATDPALWPRLEELGKKYIAEDDRPYPFLKLLAAEELNPIPDTPAPDDRRAEFFADCVLLGLLFEEDKRAFYKEVKPGFDGHKMLSAISSGITVPENATEQRWPVLRCSPAGNFIPPNHDDFLLEMAFASKHVFAPTCVFQHSQGGDLEAIDPGVSIVEFNHRSRHYKFIPEFWGKTIDYVSCLIIANQALKDANIPQRFIGVFHAQTILFGDPGKLGQFAEKWSLKIFNEDPGNRDYPYEKYQDNQGRWWEIQGVDPWSPTLAQDLEDAYDAELEQKRLNRQSEEKPKEKAGCLKMIFMLIMVIPLLFLALFVALRLQISKAFADKK